MLTGVVLVGGRESLDLSETNLPESLRVAGTPAPPCTVSEVVGVSASSIMVDSITDPQLVFGYQPCTSYNGLKALLAPLPLSVPGETDVPLLIYQQATCEYLCDDLDDWPTRETGQGWGSRAFPGFTTLEANNADPPGLSKLYQLQHFRSGGTMRKCWH